MTQPDLDRDARIAELLELADEQLQSDGEVDLDALKSRYPDLADELPELLDTMRAMATFGDQARSDGGLESTCRSLAGVTDPMAVKALFAPPQAPGELGRLASYRVLRLLGTGGMGIVFRAEDTKLRRPVALKVMKPALAADAVHRQRFLREAQSAASLRHENIVTIYQVDEDRGVPFLAMELLEGESLETRMRWQPRLPVATAVAIALEVARGLDAAHRAGLIHRDIKPANIWLERRGGAAPARAAGDTTVVAAPTTPAAPDPAFVRVKILDFGLARLNETDGGLTSTGEVLGTPRYMAYEQAAGETVDQRADLFSLGCVLYRMCTGRLPFPGRNSLAVLSSMAADAPPAPSGLQTDIPASLNDLILKLLAKDPTKRPASAQHVISVLQSLKTDSAPAKRAAQPPTPPPPPAGAGRWRRRIAAAAVAVCVLLGAILLVADGMFSWAPQPYGPKGKDEDAGKKVVAGKDEAANPPFVVLSDEGLTTARLPTLMAAVDTAASGSIIEIHGDGPFASPPIKLGGKALTIRAGPGFQPRIDFEPTMTEHRTLLNSYGRLVLEGLEFGCPDVELLIGISGPALFVTNCRFHSPNGKRSNRPIVCLSKVVDVRNCQFVGKLYCPIDWTFPTSGRLTLANCLIAGPNHGVFVAHRHKDVQDVDVEIVDNTIVGVRCIHFEINDERLAEALASPLPLARLQSRGNVFHAQYGVVGFSVRGGSAPRQESELQALFRRLASWRERHNVYGQVPHFLSVNSTSTKIQNSVKTLPEWRSFWGLERTDALHGAVRFRDGAALGAPDFAVETIRPDDFRLDPTSAGYRASPEQRDLGADMDIVGPGEPYFRWKQTPAYRAWLKDAATSR
jgi:serine/threonine protein kinase